MVKPNKDRIMGLLFIKLIQFPIIITYNKNKGTAQLDFRVKKNDNQLKQINRIKPQGMFHINHCFHKATKVD